MSHNLQDLKQQFLEYIEIERGRSVKTVENYDHYLTRFLGYAKITNPGELLGGITWTGPQPVDAWWVFLLCLVGVYLLLAVPVTLAVGKTGADLNYFMELCAASAMLFGLALHWAGRLRGAAARVRSIVVAFALLHIGLGRINHHACGTGRADASDKIEDVVWIAVHVKDDNIESILYSPGQFVEIGREGSKLVDLHALAFGENVNKCLAKCLAAIAIGADQRNRQDTFQRCVGNLARVGLATLGVSRFRHPSNPTLHKGSCYSPFCGAAT